jgi:hypothetical protein
MGDLIGREGLRVIMEGVCVRDVQSDSFVEGDDIMVEVMVAVLELSLDVSPVSVKFISSGTSECIIDCNGVFGPDSEPFSFCFNRVPGISRGEELSIDSIEVDIRSSKDCFPPIFREIRSARLGLEKSECLIWIFGVVCKFFRNRPCFLR